MNRETIDNTEAGAHNWLDRLMPDEPCDARHTVQWHAEQEEADFDVDYVPSGYLNGAGLFVVPKYTKALTKVSLKTIILFVAIVVLSLGTCQVSTRIVMGISMCLTR